MTDRYDDLCRQRTPEDARDIAIDDARKLLSENAVLKTDIDMVRKERNLHLDERDACIRQVEAMRDVVEAARQFHDKRCFCQPLRQKCDLYRAFSRLSKERVQ